MGKFGESRSIFSAGHSEDNRSRQGVQKPPVVNRPAGGWPAGIDESGVGKWLRWGRNAIPQYERDVKRAEWIYRKMEVFAQRFGERLMVLRRGEVLDYLAELTRRGHTEWQIMQSLDSICILLAFVYVRSWQ